MPLNGMDWGCGQELHNVWNDFGELLVPGLLPQRRLQPTALFVPLRCLPVSSGSMVASCNGNDTRVLAMEFHLAFDLAQALACFRPSTRYSTGVATGISLSSQVAQSPTIVFVAIASTTVARREGLINHHSSGISLDSTAYSVQHYPSPYPVC